MTTTTDAIQAAKATAEAAKQFTTSPDVQAKVVEILDQVQHGAVTVGNTIIKYSPTVADALLWIVRINGLQELVMVIPCILGMYVSQKLAIKYWKHLVEKRDTDEILVLGVWFLWAAFLGATYQFFAVTLNIWTWIQVFEPKLWLAKQIVAKVLQ